MNNSICGKINTNLSYIYLPTVYALVFVIGMFANCLGLKSACQSWKKLGNIKYFVFNLGVADLLYVFMLPFLIVYYATGKWFFGTVFCKVIRFLFNLNLYGSIGFLTCISVYRYLGIVHPLKVKGRIKTRHSVAISIIVWLLVIMQIVPDMVFDKNPENLLEKCFDSTTKDHIRDYLPYSVGWTLTGFCVPLVINLGCYGHIAVVLTVNPNINPLLKQRCLKLVIMLIVLFSVCFLPYHILRVLNIMTRVEKFYGRCKKIYGGIYVAYQISRGLACMNCAINSLMYLLVKEDFPQRDNGVNKRAGGPLVPKTGANGDREPPEPDFIPVKSRENVI